LHWATKARATRSHRLAAEVAFLAAKRQAQWKPGPPVVVDIEYRCHAKAAGYKPRDSQNAISALKAAMDGMVDAGIVKSDAAAWVEIGKVSLYTRANDPALLANGVGVTFRVRAKGC
jgi:hypothetical protein